MKLGKNIRSGNPVMLINFNDVLEDNSNVLSDNINITITGKTGSGKTTILKKIAKSILETKNEKLIVLDNIGNFKEIINPKNKDINNNNSIIINTKSDRDLLLNLLNNLIDTVSNIKTEHFLTIIIDEAHLFMGDIELEQKIIDLLEIARNKKCRVILSSQNILDFKTDNLNKNIFSMFNINIMLDPKNYENYTFFIKGLDFHNDKLTQVIKKEYNNINNNNKYIGVISYFNNLELFNFSE